MTELVRPLRCVVSRFFLHLIGSCRYYIRNSDVVVFWCARTLGAFWQYALEDGNDSWNLFSNETIVIQAFKYWSPFPVLQTGMTVRVLSNALLKTQVWHHCDIFKALNADAWALIVFLDALSLPRIFLVLSVLALNYLAQVQVLSAINSFCHLSLFRTNFKKL